MIKWWRAMRWRHEQRALEFRLFLDGPVDRWMEVRDANRAARVWRRWPL